MKRSHVAAVDRARPDSDYDFALIAPAPVERAELEDIVERGSVYAR